MHVLEIFLSRYDYSCSGSQFSVRYALASLILMRYFKFLLSLAVFALPFLQACKKDDPQPSSNNSNTPACQTNNTLSLTVTNSSGNTYRITLTSGNVEIINGETKTIAVPVTSTAVLAEQISGVTPGQTPDRQTLAYSGSACSFVDVTIRRPCAASNSATLTVTNESNNTYRVTYGGTRTVDVFANSSQTISVPAGSASVRAVQQTNIITGYGAADLTLPYNVASCGSSSVTIRPECNTIGFGEVTFVNRSSNPYRIAVNGTDVVDIPGGRQATYYLRAGSQALRATQISGFVVFPTVVNQNVNVTNCGTFSFVFP